MRRAVPLRSAVARLKARYRAEAPARQNRARGTHCFYCGAQFGRGDLQRTVDHRLPRSRDGSDLLVNMVFACRACNQRKGDRPEHEFVSSTWLMERRRAVSGRGQATR